MRDDTALQAQIETLAIQKPGWAIRVCTGVWNATACT
jgi:hypothetical protein